MALRADDVDLGRDRVLVEQYQEGDLAAFEDLYRRYYARLFRFCLRRTGNPHDAEELAQEAFARAYRAMPMLRGERRFYPWLSVIASRLCIDSHRRMGRTEPSAEVDAGSVSDPDWIDAAADHDLLEQALARLTERHREVLHLREREGWSYQRIAEHYDISMGAVEGLLFRARQALRREFIAVAGPEAGLAAGIPLAGLPVLGRLSRRLASWRTRTAEWATELVHLPGLAGNAMGLAMVVTTVAGFAGAVVSPAAPSPVEVIASASPIASLGQAHDPAAAAPAAGSGLTVAPPPADTAAGRPVPGAAVDTGRKGVVVEVDPQVVIVKDPGGKDRTQEQPLQIPTPGVIAGVDHNEIAKDGADRATFYAEQLRGDHS